VKTACSAELSFGSKRIRYKGLDIIHRFENLFYFLDNDETCMALKMVDGTQLRAELVYNK